MDSNSKDSIQAVLSKYLAHLITVRIQEGETVTSLAKKARVDKSTVSRWRSESTKPKLAEAIYSITRWGGSVPEALRQSGCESAAFLLEITADDPELRDGLEIILRSDHPLGKKWRQDIKEYAAMLKS